MDDTGYFSVQVITKALALWNLDLIPLNSTDTISTNIRQNPTHAQAYIFNMENHWFCIRRFKCIGIDDSVSNDGGEAINRNQPSTSRVSGGGSGSGSGSASVNVSLNTSLNGSQTESKAFFNLDSLLSRPSYMSSTYLTEYLRQMRTDGYSIFVISGMFPECSAEPLLKLSDIEPSAYIDLTEDQPKENVKPNDNNIPSSSKANNQTKKENQQACSWSFRNRTLGGGSTATAPTTTTHNENADLEAALRLSLECFGDRPAAIESNVLQPTNENATLARLRDKRLAYFDAMDPNDK